MGSEDEAVKETRAAYRSGSHAARKVEAQAPLRGVQYLVDESGERTAVVISLKEWGQIWEDFYDVLVSESRKDEPTVPWKNLKAELPREEPMSGGI